MCSATRSAWENLTTWSLSMGRDSEKVASWLKFLFLCRYIYSVEYGRVVDTKSGHDDASKCYSFFATEVLNLTLTSCTFPCFERVVPIEGINLPLPFELLCTLVLIPVGLNPITFCFRVDPAKTYNLITINILSLPIRVVGTLCTSMNNVSHSLF